MVSNRTRGVSGLHSANAYYTGVGQEQAVSTQEAQGHKFDSFSLSSAAGERSPFLDMVGRLSQEVRAQTTTGDIQALREQVANGTYTPDPAEIAARMLFLKGA